MTEIITKMMYDGDVQIDFYPVSHQYKIVKEIDGKKVKENLLSVSGICGVVDKSQPLIHWATGLARDYLIDLNTRNPETCRITNDDVIRACQLHNEKKEESANIGTLAHDWVEQFIKTGAMTLPEDQRVANAVTGFLNWKSEHTIEFIVSERFVYSKAHNYVGILDIIAIVDGKKYLIDIKTSNKIRLLEYGMQTSGYKKAYEEETGDMLDGIIIVKFAKDDIDKYGNPIPSFEVQEIVDIDYFFDAFLSAKVLKEAVKRYEKF